MSKPKLSVNLNKVALLRNARPLNIPNVVATANDCIAAGAHGITVHPRPDQRHIRYDDVDQLAALLSDFPEIEYNIEGNPFTGELLEAVLRVKPTQCTLVPDTPGQSTSDHGWDLTGDSNDSARAQLCDVISELQSHGIRVSLFMDADLGQIEAAASLAARPERIELYTEPYATAFDSPQHATSLALYSQAAARAQALGLGVNAGHDLNLANLPAFAAIAGVLECSIGHALIADALSYGLSGSVKKYLAVLGWPVDA